MGRPLSTGPAILALQRGMKGSLKGDVDIDVEVAVDRYRLLLWLFKGGFKVRVGTVERYISSSGTDFDIPDRRFGQESQAKGRALSFRSFGVWLVEGRYSSQIIDI